MSCLASYVAILASAELARPLGADPAAAAGEPASPIPVQRVLGLSGADLLGQPVVDWLHPEDRRAGEAFLADPLPHPRRAGHGA